MRHPISAWSPGTDPGPQILDALSAAIAARSSRQHYPLAGGELVDELPRRYKYRYTLVGTMVDGD